MGEVKEVHIPVTAEKFAELWKAMGDGMEVSEPQQGFSAIQCTHGDLTIKFWIKE